MNELTGCSGRGTNGEQEICHVLLHGSDVRDDVCCFAYAFALPGEDRLIDAEATGRDGQQSTVRWDFITNRHGDYIARDEFRSMDASDLASSKNFCFVGRVFLESLG